MMRKKEMLKRLTILGCILLMIFSFAACGSKDTKDDDAAEPGNTVDQTQGEQELVLAKYKEAMQNMLDDKVFPNGEPLYTNAGEEQDIWDTNTFAITDIDGDGADELLINFSNAPMVGEQFYVFQYEKDSDSFREELREFPLVDFYDNGYVTVQASHNQGKAGEFWPYAIYRYDAENDSYKQEHYIDAWDKTYFPEDYEGNAFPDETDTSKTGIVYYLYTDLTQAVEPSDKTAYDKLVEDTYGPAAKIDINYIEISQENIDAIA